MKKVGLFGGTFDPVHITHLIAAQQALQSVSLDEIWFVPSSVPPHKAKAHTSGEHRLNMLQQAIRSREEFRTCDVELKREGPSYTVDTVRQLVAAYPRHTFYFIVGGDMVATLHQWNEIDILAEKVTFIGLARPGYAFAKTTPYPVLQVEMPQMDVSSSMIRQWVQEGRTIRYLVPDAVYDYIKENRLYEQG